MATEETHHHPVERRRSSRLRRSGSPRHHARRRWRQLRRVGFFAALAVASVVAGYMVSRCDLTTEPVQY